MCRPSAGLELVRQTLGVHHSLTAHTCARACAGGVHVLQTFLSLKKADEVQIQGRTARQGKQGTYALVLLQKDLVDNFKLSGSTTSSVAQRDMYSTLDCARSAVQFIACNETETALADATSIDKLTHQYFDAVLKAGAMSQRSVAAGHLRNLYQLQRGKEPMTASSYHVVFLADKSGSMSSGQPPSQRFCDLGYPNPLGCALEACDRFVRMRAAAGASDKISLVMFDSGVEPAIQGADLHPELIINLLERVRFNYGGTAFCGAFEQASSIARRESMPVLLMFLTDGCDGGCQARLDNAINLLHQNANVSMKAVGFGSHCNEAHLRGLAARFGERGEYLAAIDGVQLVESFEAAAAELSHTGGR